MSSRPSAAEMARWITKDADLVAHVVEEILRVETWWVAVRSRKFAHPTIPRADGGALDRAILPVKQDA